MYVLWEFSCTRFATSSSLQKFPNKGNLQPLSLHPFKEISFSAFPSFLFEREVKAGVAAGNCWHKPCWQHGFRTGGVAVILPCLSQHEASEVAKGEGPARPSQVSTKLGWSGTLPLCERRQMNHVPDRGSDVHASSSLNHSHGNVSFMAPTGLMLPRVWVCLFPPPRWPKLGRSSVARATTNMQSRNVIYILKRGGRRVCFFKTIGVSSE